GVLRACRTRELAFRSAFWHRVRHGGVAYHLRLLAQPARRLERILARTRRVEQHRSDGAADRARAPVDRERPGREEQTETLGEVGELGGVHVRGEHHELLPTPAEDEVARP